MKICSKCKAQKKTSDFYFRIDTKKTQNYCKSCFHEYQTERWLKRKIECIAYLGGKCIACGFSGHPSALQFHHRDPSTKTRSIANWIKRASWDKVTIELDKCDLLCANCHAIHHATSMTKHILSR